MKKHFSDASLKLKKTYNIDVVDDILLGKKDRVFLYANISDKTQITLHLISNHFTLIGLDDVESMPIETILSHIDFDNRYAEVAGIKTYKNFIYDSFYNFDQDMNFTFPIIYKNKRTWINFDGFKVEKNPNIFAIFASNISKLMEKEEAIYDKTHKDALTHLFNKYTFDFHYGLRYELDDIHILYMDLDDFKIINDTYGHHIGNDVLVAFADILRSYDTDIDRFYRLGGDEFIGMHFGKTDDILKMANDILERVRLIKIPHHDKPITVSIGVIKGVMRHDMAKKADELLYQAKNQGKNQIVFAIES